MKFKPVYVYIVLLLAFIVSLMIFSPRAKQKAEISAHGQMPDDEFHRSITSENKNIPSKENVAKEAIEKLNQLKDDYEKNPNDTLKTRLYADMLMLSHQEEKAIELYEKILNVDKNRVDILLHLNYLYFNKGEIDKAENITMQILKIKKNFPLALYNMGVISQVKGDTKKARFYWNEVIKIEPNGKLAKNAKMMLDNLEKIKK
ncbi:MAG: tetratricopeptide repeat protein [Melioribacter sp.]|nr:tetratricopeptide repeat protein [Melioribacter sp.]